MALAPHSTGAIAQALSGVDFPADRNKLKDYARDRGADPDVLEVLEQIPDSEYASMAEVFKGVGKVQR